MARITSEQYEPAFEFALKVESGQASQSAATALLSSHTGLKSSSSAFYLNALLAMFEGAVYKKTISLAATRYYLERIKNEMQPEALERALVAVKLHLDYYAVQGKGEQVSIRTLMDSYRANLTLSVAKVAYSDEVPERLTSFIEDGVKQVIINAYERDPKARTACIEKYSATCQVCDFNFETKYGEIGKGFINVHHKVDIAIIGKSYQVDPVNDLIPVCPNCHAMLHTEKPAMDIEKLKQLIDSSNT
ncbi:HNH endonuclease [Shewanella baltica]|uniref:HNH endonuclease n=1 Tax=Shewanella baltica TaxID=62322 RepID=UPI00325C83B9